MRLELTRRNRHYPLKVACIPISPPALNGTIFDFVPKTGLEPARRRPLAIDEYRYRWRHLIENFFGKLKEFKRIAMRSDKTDASFKAVIYPASAVIQSR